MIVTKLSLSCLKCCTMDPWLKVMFQKPFERRNMKFLSVFSASKCCLSPRLGIDKIKLVWLVRSSIVTKLSLSCLRCSTMEPWLKLKFPKHFEIRIRTFVSVLSASKCHFSPRDGMVISKLVLYEKSLIIAKSSLSCLKCSIMDTWVKLKFPTHREMRI